MDMWVVRLQVVVLPLRGCRKEQICLEADNAFKLLLKFGAFKNSKSWRSRGKSEVRRAYLWWRIIKLEYI